jgi:lipopolysaccharide transport system ATP-binding protein
MMHQPVISLNNVKYRYKIRKQFLRFKTYTAISNLSLDLFEGETLGIIGRNGAGKSTLLKLIAGILLPDQGQIIIPAHKTISLLTLQLGFSAHLTGRENAILSAMLMGYSKREAISKLDKITSFSELDGWIDEPLKTYSSGMRARLGFAVSMEMNPDILLIDEILGVGDEAFRKKSTQMMKMKMKSGQTAVYVSHQTRLVRELCNRTLWLENSQSKMLGDTKDVLRAYHEWNKQLLIN